MYLYFETKRALDVKQEQEKELRGGGIRKLTLALYQEMTSLGNVNIPITFGTCITNRISFELSRGTIRVAVSTCYKLWS